MEGVMEGNTVAMKKETPHPVSSHFFFIVESI